MQKELRECDKIISDEDILRNYAVKEVTKITFAPDLCKSASIKQCKIDLIGKNGVFVTYLPIERAYHAQKELRAFDGIGKVAEHKLFILNETYRGKGIASTIAKNEEQVYLDNKFNEVHIDAAWDGVHVWRRLGYNYTSDSDKALILAAWRKYVISTFGKKEGLDAIKKYKRVEEIPLKYLKPNTKESMGEWLVKTRVLPVVSMYKRVG